MKDKIIKIFITACLLGTTAQAAELQDASLQSESFSVEAKLTFSEPISTENLKIDYINQTVQFDIPGITVPQGKVRYPIKSSKIKSLYVYQVRPDVMRTRIIYEKPIQANMFEGFVAAQARGKILEISITDPNQSFSSAKSKEARPRLLPPIDLNSELEPKASGRAEEEKKTLSAAAVLEKEFLRKIENYQPGKPKDPAVQVPIDSPPKEKTLTVAKTEVVAEPEKSAEKAADSQASEPFVPGILSKEKYRESEIPINLSESTKEDPVKSPWMRMALSLAVLLILAGAVVFLTKRYTKSAKKVGGNVRIETISQQALGPKKSLAVIRVAGEDILIGVTDYNISMIKSLSFLDEDLESEVPREFVSELDRVTDDYIQRGISRRSRPALQGSKIPEKSEAGADEYSFVNIKSLVSDRLKEMRPL